ncbi:MAG: MFS transporter, partial [Deltaproteobacteria bacterium]|nr:MFS transporter [Deltaproteobacteria bacterium]
MVKKETRNTDLKINSITENNSPYSKAYLRYALGLLFVVTLFNYTDRFVLSILIDPIQKDTGLSDSQMGLLTGIAFAFVYATLSVPIGRCADRFNRVRIVAIAIMVWSGFTALFGMTAGYIQMIGARIGVAAGEAGGVNPIYSIVGDYYPAERRGMALAVIALGGSVGTMFGFA